LWVAFCSKYCDSLLRRVPYKPENISTSLMTFPIVWYFVLIAAQAAILEESKRLQAENEELLRGATEAAPSTLRTLNSRISAGATVSGAAPAASSAMGPSLLVPQMPALPAALPPYLRAAEMMVAAQAQFRYVLHPLTAKVRHCEPIALCLKYTSHGGRFRFGSLFVNKQLFCLYGGRGR
jgi:hypothetical protein